MQQDRPEQLEFDEDQSDVVINEKNKPPFRVRGKEKHLVPYGNIKFWEENERTPIAPSKFERNQIARLEFKKVTLQNRDKTLDSITRNITSHFDDLNLRGLITLNMFLRNELLGEDESSREKFRKLLYSGVILPSIVRLVLSDDRQLEYESIKSIYYLSMKNEHLSMKNAILCQCFLKARVHQVIDCKFKSSQKLVILVALRAAKNLGRFRKVVTEWIRSAPNIFEKILDKFSYNPKEIKVAVTETIASWVAHDSMYSSFIRRMGIEFLCDVYKKENRSSDYLYLLYGLKKEIVPIQRNSESLSTFKKNHLIPTLIQFSISVLKNKVANLFIGVEFAMEMLVNMSLPENYVDEMLDSNVLGLCKMIFENVTQQNVISNTLVLLNNLISDKQKNCRRVLKERNLLEKTAEILKKKNTEETKKMKSACCWIFKNLAVQAKDPEIFDWMLLHMVQAITNYIPQCQQYYHKNSSLRGLVALMHFSELRKQKPSDDNEVAVKSFDVVSHCEQQMEKQLEKEQKYLIEQILQLFRKCMTTESIE